jgi:hypothetical protein
MAREKQKLLQAEISMRQSPARNKKEADTEDNNDFKKYSNVHEGRCRTLGYGLGETWFEIQDFKLEKIFLNKRFWWDVVQHVFFPLIVISKFSLLTQNLAALRSDTSSQKLASIWLRKLLGFAAAWIAFVSTMVVWKLSGQDVSNVGDHLLRNISMV